MNTETARKMLCEQIQLLVDWNSTNIKSDPEQVRKNIETVLSLVNYLSIINPVV